MKFPHKITENVDWNSIRTHTGAVAGGRPSPKFLLFLVILASSIYVLFTITFLFSSHPCHDNHPLPTAADRHHEYHSNATDHQEKTELKHIMFGIAASASLWEKRKEYLKLWWRPEKEMRGYVWLDRAVKTFPNDILPRILISGNTSGFRYTNKKGHRSAIRISRIVSETVRLGVNGVRWFVMGDDDTVFITDNLVRVLSKYDHGGFYYIGSSSESHVQNIAFSYLMAYGGGGFAISYPLAVAIEEMQDRCIKRYPSLYGSDDRMQACMAELGVPLTKELGFHQCDIYGDLFGILAAHPVTPLVTLHHLDLIQPIFPNMTRVQSLKHLMLPMKFDSAGLVQQSICYEVEKKWTITVSWGFAVQVFRGYLTPKEVEIPPRTFSNWYKNTDYKGYAFNTRPIARNPCQKAFIFYLSKAKLDLSTNVTETQYMHHRVTQLECKWKMPDPGSLEKIVVYKKTDPHLWDRSPRRNCCRVKASKKKSLILEVSVCKEMEISAI
ncbi:uncharacterized protein LOC124930478 [Impatiens glandulifera]|uniref:uncharacterized protein LOC124930478 n=1 Tax=Impatiens glandulifera TaxID=253017 RepID=UPI001FB0D04D|nr:uncharacterized protein LOC124930478 [Impatiens glandulifera]